MTKKDYFEFAKDFFQECLKISEKKNADYTGVATDPFANFTAVEAISLNTVDGFLTRMMDKMQRVSSFNKMGQLQVKDESVTDTLRDLANYSCLLAGYIKSQSDKARNTVASHPYAKYPLTPDECFKEPSEILQEGYARWQEAIDKHWMGNSGTTTVTAGKADIPPIDKELKPLRFGKPGEPFLTDEPDYKEGLKTSYDAEKIEVTLSAGSDRDVFIPNDDPKFSYKMRHFYPNCECGTWNNFKVIKMKGGLIWPDSPKDDLGNGPGLPIRPSI